MEHNYSIKYPPYLRRKLIYETKSFGPLKCRINFKPEGIAEIISYSNNLQNINDAKALLQELIEDQESQYEADRVKFKQGLKEPLLISEKDLDVAKIDFDSKTHRPKQIASYQTNFSTSKPYVVIPASPAVYNKPNVPFDISPTGRDNDVPHADVNKALFKHPYEPMLIACQTLIKDFSLADYDILTDRNNLRKLLSWAMQEGTKLCRIDVELYDGCLVLGRCDEQQSEADANTHSSAWLFERKCLRKPSQVAYHIIGSFDLGNNKVLMRYEVDGQMSTKNSDDAITTQLKGASIKDNKEIFNKSDVAFVVHSKQQEQLEYIALKSIMKDRFNLSDPKLKMEYNSIYFQSFIAGINHFAFGLKESKYLGQRKRSLQVTKVIEETLASLEPHVDVAKMVAAMKKVIALLNYVQKKMKDGIDKAALLYDPQSDQLLFYRRTGDPLIPPHFPFTK